MSLAKARKKGDRESRLALLRKKVIANCYYQGHEELLHAIREHTCWPSQKAQRPEVNAKEAV